MPAQSWLRISTRGLFVVLLAGAATAVLAQDVPKASPDWSFNGTVIEACSCPVFCQCFFNTKPAAHAGHHGEAAEHFCRFNIAYKVNGGSYGETDLKGAKFWVSGDLGHDFSQMDAEWAVVTFDPSVNEGQRAGIAQALGRIYPLKWKSFSIAEDAEVVWNHGDDGAHATLGGGKIAEIVLTRGAPEGSEPVTIANLTYIGAPRNDGFVVMPNEIESYKVGDKAFEFKGTTGFMTTIDVASADYSYVFRSRIKGVPLALELGWRATS